MQLYFYNEEAALGIRIAYAGVHVAEIGGLRLIEIEETISHREEIAQTYCTRNTNNKKHGDTYISKHDISHKS